MFVLNLLSWLYLVLVIVLLLVIIFRQKQESKQQLLEYRIELALLIFSIVQVICGTIVGNIPTVIIYFLLAIYYTYYSTKSKKQYLVYKDLEEQKREFMKYYYKQYYKNITIEGEFREISDDSED